MVGFLAGGVMGLVRGAGAGVEDVGRKSWRYSINSERSFKRCSSFAFPASSVFFWAT